MDAMMVEAAILHRLHRLQGQIGGLTRMYEDERPALELLHGRRPLCPGPAPAAHHLTDRNQRVRPRNHHHPLHHSGAAHDPAADRPAGNLGSSHGRRTGSWRAPGLALAAFAAIYTVSALLIGPAISDATQPPAAPTESVDHHGHDA